MNYFKDFENRLLPIEEFYKLGVQIIGKKSLNIKNEYFMTPDLLFTELKDYKKQRINFWEEFEVSNRSIETEEMKLLLFQNLILSNKYFDCYLLTDEGIEIKKCFQFRSVEFEKFVDDYEQYFNLGFAQPSDYTLLVPEFGIITTIFHEGYVFEYSGNIVSKGIAKGSP